MNNGISIRPADEVCQHYSQISALTRENPVAITVDGREDTVLLSHEEYRCQQRYISELEARLAVYAHLAKSLDDIKCGRTHDADDVYREVTAALDELELHDK